MSAQTVRITDLNQAKMSESVLIILEWDGTCFRALKKNMALLTQTLKSDLSQFAKHAKFSNCANTESERNGFNIFGWKEYLFLHLFGLIMSTVELNVCHRKDHIVTVYCRSVKFCGRNPVFSIGILTIWISCHILPCRFHTNYLHQIHASICYWQWTFFASKTLLMWTCF